MAYYKKLIGEKCYLSPIADEDATLWAKWYNDINISMPESNVYDVVTLTKCGEMVKDCQSQMSHVFTVVDLKTDRAVGRVEVESNPIYGSASFGILIGKEDWGEGFGKDATLLILDFAFNCLNMHSMNLGVYEFNTRAYNLYKSVGFKDIGRKREYQLVGGKRYDMLLMDMLASEYQSVYIKKVLEEMEN